MTSRPLPFVAEALDPADRVGAAGVLDCFRNPDGSPDALRCALLFAGGRVEAVRLLSEALAAGAVDAEALKKQGVASYGEVERSYLSNVRGLRYHVVAEALGVHAEEVAVPLGGPADDVDTGIRRFAAALAGAAAVDGPSLVELVLPSTPDVWAGIWLTRGFEQAQAGDQAPVAAARVR